jgi:hypothetical protein
MLRENGATTVVVFSHPNHELAIFGLLQWLRPRLIYLTDGGGEKRVEQTRQGLKSIDLLDHAYFLNYTEASFYEALLACDLGFYEEVASQLRAQFQVIRPLQILCDAIEFYNPVHDMSLPLVRAALREPAGAEIFEVPLVYQKLGEAETYELQRMSASRRGEQIQFQLSPQELAAKMRARDQVYTMLVDQMGPLLLETPRTHFALEVVGPACSSLPKPGIENFLRYERRAEMLLGRGEIEAKITYAQHYLPLTTSLMNNSYKDQLCSSLQSEM